MVWLSEARKASSRDFSSLRRYPDRVEPRHLPSARCSVLRAPPQAVPAITTAVTAALSRSFCEAPQARGGTPVHTGPGDRAPLLNARIRVTALDQGPGERRFDEASSWHNQIGAAHSKALPCAPCPPRASWAPQARRAPSARPGWGSPKAKAGGPGGGTPPGCRRLVRSHPVSPRAPQARTNLRLPAGRRRRLARASARPRVCAAGWPEAGRGQRARAAGLHREEHLLFSRPVVVDNLFTHSTRPGRQ